MSKRNRSQAHGRGAAARRDKLKQALPVRLRSALGVAPDLLLHPVPPDERPWKYLLPVLALAFVARAAIALSGDFVLHPDEIMQYLEPAHRLVFGNGVTYWEYFYGARSWLVPGLVAGVLKLFDIVGLGQPAGTSAASSSCFARSPCSFRRACTFLPGGTLAKLRRGSRC